MGKIYNAKLSKNALNTVDKTERAFLFTIAHLFNEVAALHKLLLWTTTYKPTNDAENFGRLTYQFMFLRACFKSVFLERSRRSLTPTDALENASYTQKSFDEVNF